MPLTFAANAIVRPSGEIFTSPTASWRARPSSAIGSAAYAAVTLSARRAEDIQGACIAEKLLGNSGDPSMG
ncbi:hypothetical protein PEC18_34960 [Paucibacter sp. O1-1]|nr:hypothetical protein [Paucibacter sp. O1-1]MDA3830877.1 hypothetical protein [Paucibacter sp. O1-1]